MSTPVQIHEVELVWLDEHGRPMAGTRTFDGPDSYTTARAFAAQLATHTRCQARDDWRTRSIVVSRREMWDSGRTEKQRTELDRYDQTRSDFPATMPLNLTAAG